MKIRGKSKLPDAPISSGTMEHQRTGRWRCARPVFAQSVPACQAACPTGSDVESWIRLMQEGRHEETYRVATIENPFPAITGRICMHPCTEACNRRQMGGAVNIKALERAVADAMGDDLPVPSPYVKPTGKRVAIAGSGPSGLACAYHLKRLGHEVTIFERAQRAGGMLRYGIPTYRLPREVVDREIRRLERMGIVIETGKPITDAAHMQSLRQDYDAVYLSIGAQRPRALGLDEEHAPGVMSGLEYLKRAAEGSDPRVGKRGVVIGGSNTAVDAARTALRFGAKVTLVHPGTREGLSAFSEHVEDAAAEGVELELMTEPIRILTANGHASGIMCRRLERGEPNEEGMRRLTPVEGSEVGFDADAIISATGERIDTSIVPSALHIEGGTLRIDATGRTEWPNVFAGGDFVEESHTVAGALATGKRSSIAIDCLLRSEGANSVIEMASVEGRGPTLMCRYVKQRAGTYPIATTIDSAIRRDRVVRFEDLNPAYFEESDPVSAPALIAGERISAGPLTEIEGPLSDEAQAAELARCFHCGRCTECDNCYIYCPDVSIAKRDGGYDVDLDHCKGCGVCAAECPRSAMEMREEKAGV